MKPPWTTSVSTQNTLTGVVAHALRKASGVAATRGLPLSSAFCCQGVKHTALSVATVEFLDWKHNLLEDALRRRHELAEERKLRNAASKLMAPTIFACLIFAPVRIAAQGHEDRLRHIAARLDVNVAEFDKGEFSLSETLESLEKLINDSADPGKLAQKKVAIRLRSASFPENTFVRGPENSRIRFRTKWEDVPIRTILHSICKTLDAGYIVRNDGIEIVSTKTLQEELELPQTSKSDLRSLVVQFYDQAPLREALTDLALKYNRTVLLSPQAEKQLEQKVTARLLNLPFPAAVATLAELADLKVVQKSNVFLITPKDHSKELND